MDLDKKGGGDDVENDMQLSSSAFEALEREFQEVSIYHRFSLLYLYFKSVI